MKAAIAIGSIGTILMLLWFGAMWMSLPDPTPESAPLAGYAPLEDFRPPSNGLTFGLELDTEEQHVRVSEVKERIVALTGAGIAIFIVLAALIAGLSRLRRRQAHSAPAREVAASESQLGSPPQARPGESEHQATG